MKLTHTVSSHARCGWALGEIFTFSKIYFFCIFEASGIRLKHKVRGLTQYSCHSDNLWMRRGKRGLIGDIPFDMELDRGWICTPKCDPLLIKMTTHDLWQTSIKLVDHTETLRYRTGGSLFWRQTNTRAQTQTHTNTHPPTQTYTHTHTRTHTHARKHFCKLKQKKWGWKLICTELADHSFRENYFREWS